MDIKGTEVAEKTGNWKVEYYNNGNLLAELPFQIERSARKGCAASDALGDDNKSLKALRTFRDQVLNKTKFGRHLVELFYKYSPALIKTMKSNPTLKSRHTDDYLKPVPQ